MRALEQLASIFKGQIVAPLRVDKIIMQEKRITKSLIPPRVPVQSTMFHKEPKVKSQPVAKLRIPHLPLLLKFFPTNNFTTNHVSTVKKVNMSGTKKWNKVLMPEIANNALCK